MGGAVFLLFPACALIQAPQLDAKVKRFIAAPWRRVDHFQEFPAPVQAVIKKWMGGAPADPGQPFAPDLGGGGPQSRMVFGGAAPGLAFLYLESSDSPFCELLFFSTDHSGHFHKIADWHAPLNRSSIEQLQQGAREGGLTPVDHSPH